MGRTLTSTNAYAPAARTGGVGAFEVANAAGTMAASDVAAASVRI